ncbi:MAG: hypothetical protein ACREXW_00950 [Gammaproteobacteria bacterium]
MNKLLDTGAFRTVFNLSFIDIWSGSRPATPDEAIPTSSVKLCTITNNSTATGLTFEAAAVAGEILKKASETWSGTILADGIAGFFRLRENSDAGTAATTTLARIDGTVGTSGADLNLSSTTLVAAAPLTVPTGKFKMPKE